MDALTRFLIESGCARGEHVVLSDSWSELLSRQAYPEPVRELLGHALAAAALFSPTIKSSGKVTLQIQGGGSVRLLVAQCSGDGEVRAMATYDLASLRGSSFADLVGEGRLVVTLERDSGRQYQGIVELCGDSLASALEQYFSQSEQVPCQIHLATGSNTVAGFLLQRMPDAKPEDEDWERVCALTATLSPEELLGLEPGKLLHRLFHDETVRVFSPRKLAFGCACSKDRILSVLSNLERAEIDEIIAKEGELVVTCEFCNARYPFEQEQLGKQLEPPTQH